MKNYLSMNTMYLTNKGFKYIHELTNEDSLIYKKLVGNIGMTNNFSTKIDKIDKLNIIIPFNENFAVFLVVLR